MEQIWKYHVSAYSDNKTIIAERLNLDARQMQKMEQHLRAEMAAGRCSMAIIHVFLNSKATEIRIIDPMAVSSV